MTAGIIHIQQWSEDTAKKELKKRLAHARKYRNQFFESKWRDNESVVFQEFGQSFEDGVGYSDIDTALNGDSDLAGGYSEMGINYAFKYHRFILSQMSANPPSVVPVPTSSEYKDRRAATVADNFIQYGRRKLKLQEKIDLTSLQTLTYGTGFNKIYYDAFAGEAWETDVKTGTITMQGDIRSRPMLIWNMYIDPEADEWEDVRYTFERHFLSCEEAIAKFPKHKRKLMEMKGQMKKEAWQADEKDLYEDVVEVFEYYEKALPWNGMAGRHCYMLSDGTPLTPLDINPHVGHRLPYHICTDVDVPGQVYGKTFIDYIVRLQDILNKLDSTVLDNVQAHAVARLVVFDGAEPEDESETNDGWDILYLKGNPGTAPMYINPPALMPDLYRLRQSIVEGMEAIAGTNESMFGQVKREMSGFSLQTAINAGNMVRRRLFNKYTSLVEGIYKDYLELIKKHYNDKRKILIAGEEEAMSVAYYSGADISEGFDLQVEYGTSFSLDPASRREEIMQLMPFLKEAGYSMRQIISMLRLNTPNLLVDMVEVAKRRQIEIFDEMIAKYEKTGTVIQIEPEKNEDHVNMLEAAQEFRMSATFKALHPELKALIDSHIDTRMEKAAELASPPTPPPSSTGGLGGIIPEAGGQAPIPAGAPPPMGQ